MGADKREFGKFVEAVEQSGRYPKAILKLPDSGGNMATINGEVASHADHDAITELARQHGFHLFAQELFIPAMASRPTSAGGPPT
jgi:hypothetical protein